MMQYFRQDLPGTWHELALPYDALGQSGSAALREGALVFRDEPCKASSFYHIACAIETLLLHQERGCAAIHQATASPMTA
jgi:hypothetical protein